MNQESATVPHKTMDRDDLLAPEGQAFVRRLDRLARELEARRLPVTSWYGGLPLRGFELSRAGLRALARRVLGRGRRRTAHAGAIGWVSADSRNQERS